MKILLFTDSRGQHTAQGTKHLVYGEMLANTKGLHVDRFYCPFKWTTTLDFLSSFDARELARYDHVLLQTGIVDFSPRPFKNAYLDLYNCNTEENTSNISLDTRDYSKKVRNWKKPIFDRIFGEDVMKNHFSRPFESFYNGEKTINMYSLEMAKMYLLPRLNDIPNLLYINTNRIANGWDGDYPRERPSNMSLIHDYCKLFSKSIKQTIDLSRWSDSEIRRYTTDNIHLTEEGNDYIFNRVLEHIGRPKEKVPEQCKTKTFAPFWKLSEEVSGFNIPETITEDKRSKILESYKIDSLPIASIVISFKLKDDDPNRLGNLVCLLDWIHHYYPDLFEIVLLEQDIESKFDKSILKHNERHEFIYNPSSYNRGWGYNVAVKHFVTTPVIVAADTDVLPGRSFLSSILQCYKGKDFVSPYRNVFYSSEDEAQRIRDSLNYNCLHFEEEKLKNPVSITGGMFIANCDAYRSLAGYEQYMGYACEDRSFDTAICELANPNQVLIQNETYVHLWHPLDAAEKKDFNKIYKHLVDNYGCEYHPELTYRSYMHEYCSHKSGDSLRSIVQYRRQSDEWGDLKLYSKSNLQINGLRSKPAIHSNCSQIEAKPNPIYPDEFTTLDDYEAREEYSDISKPSEGIKHFYNKYKGQRCVIIGNGPSLNNIDLGKVQNEYTFGVNSLYYKTRETGFLPTFFVVEDSSVMKENLAAIKQYRPQYKFFPTIYKNLHGEGRNVLFFKMNRGFYEKSSPNYCVPRFSTDFSQIAYCGQSVTHINLQLAYFMGFSEVYLVGMDFSYVIPDSHSRKGDVLYSDTDDPNHFHKDYFGKGKSWKDPKLDRVLMNYKQAKLAYESSGRKIYNATHGGKLDVFPRVDYNTIFDYNLSSSYSESLNQDLSTPDELHSHESLYFHPEHGLITTTSKILSFGFTRRVRRARILSYRNNTLLNELDIDLVEQSVEIESLLKSSATTTKFLLEIKYEGDSWVSLGGFSYGTRFLLGQSKLKFHAFLKCRSLIDEKSHFSALFRNMKNRISLKLFTKGRVFKPQGNQAHLISPLQLDSCSIIGFSPQ